MGNRVRLVVVAVAPALFSLAANVVTDGVGLPPAWWYGAMAACGVLATVLVFQTYRELSGTRRRSLPASAPAGTAASGPVTVLEGGRTGDLHGSALWVLGGVFVLGMMAMLASLPGIADRDVLRDPAEPSYFEAYPVGMPVCLAGTFVLLFLLPALVVGIGRHRGRLEFSAGQLVFVKGRLRLVVPWSEVAAVEVRSACFGGTWLLAHPLPGSPLLTGGPAVSAYDPGLRAIRVCDLRAAGISRHAVEAALTRWNP
ncbi:hypothetical protein [Kitasatospora sp. NPDC051914]|uniref:hypothetical protein n=1 Tax=Kitasatospora sp. NPDC051914 TaxID=3154945 RepID=UPI003421C4D8